MNRSEKAKRAALISFAQKKGWTGTTVESLKNWMLLEGYDAVQLEEGSDAIEVKDFDGIWGKGVTIVVPGSATSSDVEVADDAMEAMEDDEDAEGKADEDEDEEAVEKSARNARLSKNAAKHARSQEQFSAVKRANLANIHTNKAGSAGVDAGKMAYDRAVKSGARISRTGMQPLFLDAGRSEYFGAKSRLVAMGDRSYAQRDNDESIVSKGSSVVNSTGGALVFYEELPELIENLESNGAARQAIGVTNMRDGEQTVSKVTADVTVYDIGEGDAITSSDPTFGNVKLVASKTAALIKESSELLNDSAFAIGDILARSVNRAIGKYEDEAVFLGQHNRQGITDILTAGGTNVQDAALTAAWSEYTIGDLQDMMALLPAWAYEDPKFGFVCSLSFAQSVFYRFGLDAGGNTGANLEAGFGGLRYNGFPIYISQVMPKSYSANQLSCFAGAWSHACKFGVVSGSEQMATSDQRYFDQDQVAFRYTQRWAHNLHDVNTTANASGIVALQD